MCDIPFDAINHIPMSDIVYYGTVSHDCDANWKSSNGKGCKTYEAENYCKKDGDHYGSGWSYHSWGTFERYADSAGRTPLVCPECGCNGGVKLGRYPGYDKVPKHASTACRQLAVFCRQES